MSPSGHESEYTAYLLRCWRDGMVWRYSLERIDGGKRHGFADLEGLIAFLHGQTAAASSARGGDFPAADIPPPYIDRDHGSF